MSTTDTNGLRWWKSTRSDSQGGNCVEVATTWRKSSRSGGQGGECVEVADDGGHWFVRDSKNPDGGILTVSGTAWHAFLRQLTPAEAVDPQPAPVRELPAFVGAGDSGRSDISQRFDEFLDEEGSESSDRS